MKRERGNAPAWLPMTLRMRTGDGADDEATDACGESTKGGERGVECLSYWQDWEMSGASGTTPAERLHPRSIWCSVPRYGHTNLK